MTNVFPLTKGKISLTTGTISLGVNKLVHCEADGALTIIWADNSTTPNVALIAGDDRSIPGATGVTITAGTFSIA